MLEPILDMPELPDVLIPMPEQPVMVTTTNSAAIFFILFLQLMR